MRNNQTEDFIVFGQPLIEQEEIDEVVDSLKKSWLGTGPKVNKFESDFRKYKNIDYCAAVGSATAGLFLAMKALEIGSGDEVITTAMTFVATVNAIVHTGAAPVLADIDPITWNINPDEIEKRITPKTKAILPVHFAGRACDMEAIMFLAKKYNLFVIEDCAHAVETEYKGKKAGTFGDFGVFSFYATKNITTGEGGMVISNNKEKINRIKKLALHGLSLDAWRRFSDSGYKHYYATEPGYKFNMMDLQAAIGIHQLRKIERFRVRRKEIWEFYLKNLQGLPIGLPDNISDDFSSRHALHLFNIVVGKKSPVSRDEFLIEMTKSGIGVGVHYSSITRHTYYEKMFDSNSYPIATAFGDSTISLPISPKLTSKELDKIVLVCKKILEKK